MQNELKPARKQRVTETHMQDNPTYCFDTPSYFVYTIHENLFGNSWKVPCTRLRLENTKKSMVAVYSEVVRQ